MMYLHLKLSFESFWSVFYVGLILLKTHISKGTSTPPISNMLIMCVKPHPLEIAYTETDK